MKSSKSQSGINKDTLEHYKRSALLLENYEVDVNSLSRQDLMAERLRLQADILEIQTQLDHAKVNLIKTGEYADPDWYQKATYARRKKGQQIEQIQIRMAEMRHKESIKNREDNKMPTNSDEFSQEDWNIFFKILKFITKKAKDEHDTKGFE